MQHPTCTSIPCNSAAFAELASDVLGAGKALRLEARGGSMAPLVRDGDVLLVQPVDKGAVRLGDVVFCRSEAGRIVVHRVIGKAVTNGGRWFTVQGDAVSQPDGVIPGVQVCGRVEAIERSGAHIDMRGPVMRILGWAAAVRSRWSLGRGAQLRLVKRLVVALPVLRTYLA